MTPLVEELLKNLTYLQDFHNGKNQLPLFLSKEGLKQLNKELEISSGEYTPGESLEVDGFKLLIIIKEEE